MSRPIPKTFYIKTYGCQMNELDTQVMAGMLQKKGLTQIEDEKEADLLIFNTCSVRDLAERKSMGKIGLLGRREKKGRIIGVTGCMANAKKETLFRKLPNIDFVVGTNNIHELSTVIEEFLSTGEKSIHTDDVFHHEIDYTAAKRQDKHRAYVSIIRGCDKFCTYCIVPYTRGPEVSRTPEDIVNECRILVNEGYKEITLLGQNVNSYGKDKPEWQCLFPDLLYKLDAIPGKFRVRFLTSHPVDITRSLMEAIRDLPSLCEHVHFPLQAGADRILRKMHRIYTKAQYLERIALIREIVPGVALGTDMIVGFPTETEEEFMESYQCMELLRYDTAFLYTYSPRKGTPAMRWKDDVPKEIKADRHQRIFSLQNQISSEKMQEKLGETLEVLIEKRADKDPKYLKGVSRCWRNVLIEGSDSLVGTFQNVTLTSCSHQTWIGRIES